MGINPEGSLNPGAAGFECVFFQTSRPNLIAEPTKSLATFDGRCAQLVVNVTPSRSSSREVRRVPTFCLSILVGACPPPKKLVKVGTTGLVNHRSFRQPSVSPGCLTVFQKESLEGMGEVPLEW